MGRSPCCDKDNVKRGPWSSDEDATLKSYLETLGTGGNWTLLPKKAGLRRCGKSCRLRWLNYLRPDIKLGGFTEDEDSYILSLYNQMGSRWSVIASHLPGRTDNDVKNHWNTKLKKKLLGGGKLSLKTKNSKEPINNAYVALPCAPKAEPQDSAFSTFQAQIPATLQMKTDVNSGLDAYNYNLPLSLNQHQLSDSKSKLMTFSDFGASSNTSKSTVSLSQDGSSISDSSWIAAVDNKFASLPGNCCLEESEVYMDYGFGLPYDVDHGMCFGEKTNEVDLTCSTNFADLFSSCY